MRSGLLHACGEVWTVDGVMAVLTAVKAKTSAAAVVSLLLRERRATYGSSARGIDLHRDAWRELVNERSG